MWHNFCTCQMTMSIDEINRNHYFKSDMYYRVGFGLSSQLLAFRNGIIYLQVMVGIKWTKNYHDTTMEMANCWRSEHQELKDAIGCKVFIIDARKYPYKEELFQMKMQVSFDAKMGMLFCDNILN